jgi:hypothetical protein
MATYNVTGYLVTIYSVSVEAKDEATALELGEEMLSEGEGIQGDSDWQPEFDIYEEDN